MSFLDHASPLAIQIRQLREELVRDEPRYALLLELERVWSRFFPEDKGAAPVGVAATEAPPAKGGIPRYIPSPTRRQANPDSLRQRVLAASTEFLRDKTEPVPVGVIYEHLKGQGLELGGKDPRSSLSAALWKVGKFKAIGRSGWVLKGSPAARNAEAADVLPGLGSSAASMEPRSTSEGTQSAPVEPVRGGGT